MEYGGVWARLYYNFCDFIFIDYPLQSVPDIAEVINKKFTNAAEVIGASPVENAAHLI